MGERVAWVRAAGAAALVPELGFPLQSHSREPEEQDVLPVQSRKGT